MKTFSVYAISHGGFILFPVTYYILLTKNFGSFFSLGKFSSVISFNVFSILFTLFHISGAPFIEFPGLALLLPFLF